MSAGHEELLADLVFEGGGVKGIGLAGAYLELCDQGYQPGCVAGTSAGAITASLVAAGYTGEELQRIVLREMDFQKFEDGAFLDHFGRVGDIAEFLRSGGMHSGEYFLSWIRERLEAKGKRTFRDLRNPDQSDPRRAYLLRVIASDLSGRRMLVLPQDADHLGINPDELEIALAVRMSMSIPVFFRPVSKGGHEVVDGGLLSNFPVWLFDCDPGTMPRFPTFGMLLVAPNQAAPLIPPLAPNEPVRKFGSEIDFLKAIAETMMEAHDRFYVEQANYARTIPIKTLGVRTTEFDISPERAQALFNSGRDAAREFLETWDFEEYKASFRMHDSSNVRRATVHARRTRSGRGSIGHVGDGAS